MQLDIDGLIINAPCSRVTILPQSCSDSKLLDKKPSIGYFVRLRGSCNLSSASLPPCSVLNGSVAEDQFESYKTGSRGAI